MSEHTSARSGEVLSPMIENLIEQADGLLVVFSEGGCHVGEAVEPKIEALVSDRFPALRHLVVAREHAPQLIGQLGIFVFPTVVIWFRGKESARFVRTFSLESVAEAIERPYGLLFG